MAKKDEKLELFAPWYIYEIQLETLFAGDPQVTVQFDEREMEVKLLVDDPDKADALDKLLPASKTWGEVVLKITVVPCNDEVTVGTLYRRAFDGNTAFKSVIELDPEKAPFAGTYVMFAKEVVQYRSDSIADPNGVESTLWQNIAGEVFEQNPGVFFCTDVQ